MTNRISRRTVVAGALLVPFAGIGMTLAKGQNSTSDATPGASPAASPGASPMASPAAGGSDVTVVAEDIKFTETEIKIPAKTDVKITLENHGKLEHDFVVDDPKIEIGPIKGGETADTTVNIEAGEYEFYCSIPGHKEAGMVGKLIAE